MAGSVDKLVQLVGRRSESVFVVMVMVFVLATGWVLHDVQAATGNELRVSVNDSGVRHPTVASSSRNSQPLPAGDAPAFLLASVQPI